jgi:hypothetical protein
MKTLAAPFWDAPLKRASIAGSTGVFFGAALDLKFVAMPV